MWQTQGIINNEIDPNICPSHIKYKVNIRVLEETEYIAAWCSVDNWQPLTCSEYFNGKLRKYEQ